MSGDRWVAEPERVGSPCVEVPFRLLCGERNSPWRLGGAEAVVIIVIVSVAAALVAVAA